MPESASSEEMAKTNVCPFETVASTTAVALNGGVKDSTVWIVLASHRLLVSAIPIPAEEKVGLGAIS
jgi:hypothetical protein